MPLHTKMLIGLVVGIGGGLLAHTLWAGDERLASFIKYGTEPVGRIYINLLLMLVLPLIFSALVLGISGIGDLRALGRVGLKTLLCTVLLSGTAVFIGVTLVNQLQPGAGLSDELRASMLQGAEERSAVFTGGSAQKPGIDLIVNIVPRNPIGAAANSDYLGFMFFALLFGIGLRLTNTPAARKLEEMIQGLYDVMMKLISLVIRLTPLGVAALLFSLTAVLGLEILSQLGRYVGVVVLALSIHQFVVYPLALSLFGGMSPLTFFRGIREAMVMAFSTASSNATLPTSLKVAEENLRLPPQVSRFVLTIGSTANQNGTALFEGVTVLFLAQFFGVDLSLAQQIMVCGLCILAGIGTAGVPAGSLPVIAAMLGMVHVPVAGLGMILGVDRFLDMCRTVLNVSGDLVAAVIVSRGEPRS
ncbi:MAG: dicarboxylate/amino acid:cation symporter [Planctomycetota bacterium]